MKGRSKRTISGTAATQGMERSRRLRQAEPARSPRQTKKRTAKSADSGSAAAPEMVAAPQRLVHFEVIAPGAREVFLAGTFNDWKYGATPMTWDQGSKWVIELTLHPGVYEYRFVVDGEWKLDPNNTQRVPNPFGEFNSLLIIRPFQNPCP